MRRLLARLIPSVGTRSVLFGAHCLLIHPVFLAVAWWRLYGFPFDPRLWLVFFLHDFGYWGKPNMDGPEGESHPELGARLVGRWFDAWYDDGWRFIRFADGTVIQCGPWCLFSLLHSRFYAQAAQAPFSRLCVADKLAICLEPRWLYLPRVWLSGELAEYLQRAGRGKYHKDYRAGEVQALLDTGRAIDWHRGMTMSMRRWIEEHGHEARDGIGSTATDLRPVSLDQGAGRIVVRDLAERIAEDGLAETIEAMCEETAADHFGDQVVADEPDRVAKQVREASRMWGEATERFGESKPGPYDETISAMLSSLGRVTVAFDELIRPEPRAKGLKLLAAADASHEKALQAYEDGGDAMAILAPLLDAVGLMLCSVEALAGKGADHG